jgi:hypothetical protein
VEFQRTDYSNAFRPCQPRLDPSRSRK